MLTIWRRHTAECPHRAKGRDYLKCTCPIWADGYLNRKRTLRVSLKTPDMARARKRAANLEEPQSEIQQRTLAEAIAVFDTHCVSCGLKPSTLRKRRNSLAHLQQFCDSRNIVDLDEITLDTLDAFRSGRGISLLASAKELEVLKQFFRFCLVRHWLKESPAEALKPPRNLRPNDVEPYTTAEVEAMVAACDSFCNRVSRSRARAMLFAMRYTGLRIGDVALLAKDRISRDGSRWRIFLHTEKSGKPVFLPVPDELRLALNDVPTPRGASPDCRYFFWNGRMSERAAKGSVERTLRKVFRLSGVARAHAHRFRHTLATELLGAGASLRKSPMS
jgi:site-specific recombinase XerD